MRLRLPTAVDMSKPAIPAGWYPSVRRHRTISSIRNRDDDYSVYGQEQPLPMEGRGDRISSNRVDHVANPARRVVLLFYTLDIRRAPERGFEGSRP